MGNGFSENQKYFSKDVMGGGVGGGGGGGEFLAIAAYVNLYYDRTKISYFIRNVYCFHNSCF